MPYSYIYNAVPLKAMLHAGLIEGRFHACFPADELKGDTLKRPLAQMTVGTPVHKYLNKPHCLSVYFAYTTCN